MDKRKVIGIPGWKVGENSYGVGTNYLEYAAHFGNPRIIMPWEEKAEDIDILLLAGGMDVNPLSYDRVPSFHTTNQDVFKQFFFDKRLPAYIESGTPIIGICLGMQMLNVAFGGTLTQQLYGHPDSDERWEEGHEVTLIPNFINEIKWTTGLNFQKKYGVNSHHHQGVTPTDLAPHLVPLFMYGKGNESVIEVVVHKTLPIVGVQHHPEEFYDDMTTKLFKELINYDRTKERRVIQRVSEERVADNAIQE